MLSFSSHQQHHHHHQHLISVTMPTLLLRISIISHILHTILYFLPKKLRSLLPNSPASNCHGDAQVADRPSTTELDRVFRTFDRNGDGRITKEELTESLENLGIFISDRDMTLMIRKIDVDGDGCIDVEEFRTLYKGMMEMKEGNEKEEEEDMREAFEVFDVDGDGYITVEELRSVLSSLGLERGRTAEECRRMIGRVDEDGDGRVSYKEFREMMKGGGLAAMA